ncbi:hypothetical protein XarbCFBP8147_08290 [Xanthomonas arboricola]|nr:hypothetical protein XarbCFBP8147_08290 [Xanthomonas arboricola]
MPDKAHRAAGRSREVAPGCAPTSETAGRAPSKPDGMTMIMPMFQQAEAVQNGKRVKDAQIDAVFAQWVEPAN